jgi:hypothetical protein
LALKSGSSGCDEFFRDPTQAWIVPFAIHDDGCSPPLAFGGHADHGGDDATEYTGMGQWRYDEHPHMGTTRSLGQDRHCRNGWCRR